MTILVRSTQSFGVDHHMTILEFELGLDVRIFTNDVAAVIFLEDLVCLRITVDDDGPADGFCGILVLLHQTVADQRLDGGDHFTPRLTIQLADTVVVNRRTLTHIERNELLERFSIEPVIGIDGGGLSTQFDGFHDVPPDSGPRPAGCG